MTTIGGQFVASFSNEGRANRRAYDLAVTLRVPMWVHRRGPQEDRLLAGGPLPGGPYTEFSAGGVETHFAGSRTA